jgi:hypothetical protein
MKNTIYALYKNSEWGWKEATLIKIMSVVL